MNVVRIPNPKNLAEEFSFTFNGVYDLGTSQEDLFNQEGTYWARLFSQKCRGTGSLWLMLAEVVNWSLYACCATIVVRLNV